MRDQGVFRAGPFVTWHGRNFCGSLIPGGSGVTVTARND
jgi:hypothetical protein